MASLVGRALDLAFPARCPGCGARGRRSAPTACRRSTPGSTLPAGIPIGLPSDVPRAAAPARVVRAVQPGSSGARCTQLEVRRASDGSRVPLGEAGRATLGSVPAPAATSLVPVPVHADRARRRGYDQAELIAARRGGRASACRCAPRLERARATIAQFDLDRAERATNVAGAFRLRRWPRRRRRAGDVASRRWVVLVDDVVTTGATLAACAEPLLDGGRGRRLGGHGRPRALRRAGP